MPYIYTSAEYIDMLIVYGYCDCSSTAAVEKVVQTFHDTGSLRSATVYSERGLARHVEEDENIIGDVQRSPTTSTWCIAACCNVSQTHVWRLLHDEGLYPFNHSMCRICTEGTMPSVYTFVTGYVTTVIWGQ
ncbi:hypothetical protein PR048_002354 [Dryococelus australis]|uniref:Mos1 transposase HTH domain-containing protein n=1 Tax=Dryococelus australis TaxID=614101 RepID=A0ABQ9IMF6_9NEOP|nr:hypothetical protein PR048_002354 [Dryococelus australis]